MGPLRKYKEWNKKVPCVIRHNIGPDATYIPLFSVIRGFLKTTDILNRWISIFDSVVIISLI